MGGLDPVAISRTPRESAALRSMASKIDELPLLPQVLVRILQLDSSSGDYFEQFERLSEEDPALAIRIMSLANSAASAPATPIITLSDAIVRMGASTISSLVASLAVQRVFMPTKPSQVRLWTHSIDAAVAAKRIAQLLPDLKLDSKHAYLTGLLHDIGRFVMFEHAGPDLLRVDESHWHSPDELVQADIEIFKYTHSELGYLACHHWGIPPEIAAIVRNHHDPISGPITQESQEAMTFCVQTSDRLSASLLEDRSFGDMSHSDIVERIKSVCLVSEEEQGLLPATVLAENVHSICEESDRFLAGLGFAR